MKRCIVLVILACVLFVSIGIAEDAERFVFRNGITWGMSPEEVIEAEGKSPVEQFISGDRSEYIFDAEICGANSSLSYFFKNQRLISFGFLVRDETVDTEAAHEYIVASLKHKYGESSFFNPSVLYYYINKVLCFPCDMIAGPVSALYLNETIIILECSGSNEILYISEDSLYDTDGL